MGSQLTCVLGMDLGLSTGWAVVRWRGGAPVVLRAGNVRVAHLDGVSLRLGTWAHEVAALLQQAQRYHGVTCLCYEEIRRATGQGARYIVMMEGVLHGLCSLPAFPVNQATLRSFAGMRPRSASNPHPETWAKRASVVFRDASKLQSEDQAVAAFAASWLIRNAEVVR